MKRICLLLASLLLGTVPTLGQQKSEQDLAFIYIAHDEYTAVQSLIERLKDAFTDAINYPESRAVIFYLANAENPIVVQVNTKNDNQQEFDRIVDELQTKRSHNVEPVVDCAKIQEIFNADDIIDENGKGLAVIADGMIEFNALRNTVEDFDSAESGKPVQLNNYNNQDVDVTNGRRQTHINDIRPRDFVELCLDKIMMGVGGDNSWGAPVNPRYIIDGSVENAWGFTLVPVDGDEELKQAVSLEY